MEKRLPLPVGTVLQGRYRILRQLGHGGFGAVYEAVDDELNLSFALKETFYAADEDLRSAFKREARMLASLSHEAFPRVTHYFTEGDGCFLVMELIYGDDLDKLLSNRAGPFEQKLVLTWADQILDALEDLHVKGIIHRDIKPSNLKLTPKGRIKLLDFGIAKGAIEGETTILTTVGSLAAATLQYAPLEQVLKASPQYQMMLSVVSSGKVSEIMKRGTDATSDLYALAATLYQMLTKTLPADSPTRALAIWSGQDERLIEAHRVNLNVSKEVSQVLQKALSLDRDGRYRTAAELRESLKNAADPLAETRPDPILSVGLAPTELPPFVILPGAQETQPSPRPVQLQPPPPFQQIIEPRPSPAIPKTDRTVLYVLIGLICVLTVGILGFFTFRNAGTPIADNTVSNKNANLNKNAKSTPSIPADAKYKLAQTLAEHSNYVYAVAFSPDGKTIASGSFDKTIKLWDAESGALKQTLTGHSEPVLSVAFSPDGGMIASGSSDKTIKLWDAGSGALKQTLTGHGHIVRQVVFSPDGETLASGSYDQTIKLWDVKKGTLKQTLTGHSNMINAVTFSPDGKTIASGSDDKTIKLWDAGSGAFKQTLNGHDGSVYTVAFSPDGSMIASGSTDKTIKLWNAATGVLKQTLIGHGNNVWTVAFSPDSKIIASGSYDRSIKLWDVTKGTLKQTLTGHGDSVWSIVFSPDGRIIVSGSQDKTIKLWKAE